MRENVKSESSNLSRKKPLIFVSRDFRESFLAPLKGPKLSVYMAYDSHKNTQCVAWPSLRQLVRVTGYGINAVKDARSKLVRHGMLEPIEQERAGGKFGLKKFRVVDPRSTVAQKQCNDAVVSSTVAPPTVARSTVARQQCREGSPSEGSPSEGSPSEGSPAKGDRVDAVRRPGDSELRAMTIPPLGVKTESKPSLGHLSRDAKLRIRLAGKITQHDDSYASYIAWCLKEGKPHPYGKEQQAAFAAMRYEPDLDSPLLAWDFVISAVDIHEKCIGRDVTPGNMCSKLIDHCVQEEFFWPPDFQKHRNRLRQIEREHEGREQLLEPHRRTSAPSASKPISPSLSRSSKEVPHAASR